MCGMRRKIKDLPWRRLVGEVGAVLRKGGGLADALDAGQASAGLAQQRRELLLQDGRIAGACRPRLQTPACF